MPTYEYACEAGHAFEQVQKMSEPALDTCRICGGKAQRKVSGGQGLIFKGSGFYITDYGKDGKGPRKAESSEGGAAKADSAPAPAPKAETPKSGGSDSKAVA